VGSQAKRRGKARGKSTLMGMVGTVVGALPCTLPTDSTFGIEFAAQRGIATNLGQAAELGPNVPPPPKVIFRPAFVFAGAESSRHSAGEIHAARNSGAINRRGFPTV